MTFFGKKYPGPLKKNYWHFETYKPTKKNYWYFSMLQEFFQCCFSYSSPSKNSENPNQKMQDHLLVYFNRFLQRKASIADAWSWNILNIATSDLKFSVAKIIFILLSTLQFWMFDLLFMCIQCIRRCNWSKTWMSGKHTWLR